MILYNIKWYYYITYIMGNFFSHEELNELEKSLSGSSLKQTVLYLLFAGGGVRCMIYLLTYFS